MANRFRHAGWVGVLSGAACGLLPGCGEYSSGTESGNPINPPTPMTEPPAMLPGTEPPVAEPPDSPAVDPPMTGVPTGAETPVVSGGPMGVAGMSNQPEPTAPGAGAPCESSACEQQATAAVNRLSGAQPEPMPFTSAQCTMKDGVAGCDCGTTIRASAVLCAASDRFGNCIYGPSDFPGCTAQRATGGADSGSAMACSEVCSEVWRRMSEEAKAMHDIELRAAACVEMQCRYLISVSGSCYVADPLASADCAKSDEELLGGL